METSFPHQHRETDDVKPPEMIFVAEQQGTLSAEEIPSFLVETSNENSKVDTNELATPSPPLKATNSVQKPEQPSEPTAKFKTSEQSAETVNSLNEILTPICKTEDKNKTTKSWSLEANNESNTLNSFSTIPSEAQTLQPVSINASKNEKSELPPLESTNSFGNADPLGIPYSSVTLTFEMTCDSDGSSLSHSKTPLKIETEEQEQQAKPPRNSKTRRKTSVFTGQTGNVRQQINKFETAIKTGKPLQRNKKTSLVSAPLDQGKIPPLVSLLETASAVATSMPFRNVISATKKFETPFETSTIDPSMSPATNTRKNANTPISLESLEVTSKSNATFSFPSKTTGVTGHSEIHSKVKCATEAQVLSSAQTTSATAPFFKSTNPTLSALPSNANGAKTYLSQVSSSTTSVEAKSSAAPKTPEVSFETPDALPTVVSIAPDRNNEVWSSAQKTLKKSLPSTNVSNMLPSDDVAPRSPSNPSKQARKNLSQEDVPLGVTLRKLKSRSSIDLRPSYSTGLLHQEFSSLSAGISFSTLTRGSLYSSRSESEWSSRMQEEFNSLSAKSSFSTLTKASLYGSLSELEWSSQTESQPLTRIYDSKRSSTYGSLSNVSTELPRKPFTHMLYHTTYGLPQSETQPKSNLSQQKEQELQQADMKLSFSVHQAEDFIAIADCVISYEKETFDREAKVEVTLNFPKKISTGKGLVITPEIQCKVLGDFQPQKPFSISTTTCYTIVDTRDSVTARVQQIEDGGKWQTIETSNTVLKDLSANFSTQEHGRLLRCVVPHAECSKLFKHLITYAYLKKPTQKSTVFTVVWCIMDNMCHLRHQQELEMSPQKLYENVLQARDFHVRHGKSLSLIIFEEDSDDEPVVIARLNTPDLWETVVYKRFEHFIPVKSGSNGRDIRFIIKDNRDETIITSNYFVEPKTISAVNEATEAEVESNSRGIRKDSETLSPHSLNQKVRKRKGRKRKKNNYSVSMN